MSHRYRLYPTPDQEAVMHAHCGQARFVWNLALEQANHWRRGRSAPPSSAERFRQLTEARSETWLGEGSSHVQQQALRDFDQALKNWWNKSHRRPTRRKRGRHDGFCVRDVKVQQINQRWAEILVPKCGPVRFRLSRGMPYQFGMARVTQDSARRWHVSVTAAPAVIVREPTGVMVGIDRGVANTIATSTGEFLRAPRLRPREAERLLRLQRHLARQSMGSKQRDRTKRVIGRLRAREGDRRKDFVEKVTTALVRNNDVICIEDLRVKNMTRSAKGTVKSPGAKVSQKTGLNRAILRQCWGLFAQRLKDKAKQAGNVVVVVNPAHTSDKCRSCGYQALKNRESQAVFGCLECGHTEHADTHAARNILDRGMEILGLDPAAGHAVAARGAGARGQASNCEPSEAALCVPSGVPGFVTTGWMPSVPLGHPFPSQSHVKPLSRAESRD